MPRSPDDAIIRTAIELLGALDIDAVLALVTDDLVLEFPFRADGGPRRLVADEARTFFRAMPKLFSSLPFTDVVIHGTVSSGEVVAEYRSDGITRAGRPYRNQYVSFFEIRDGRIARWREFFDPSPVAAAFPGG